VNELPQNAFHLRSDVHLETEGEFAGWRTWTRDAFETHNGPFWHRMDETGKVQCVFRVEKKHLNGQRNVHGGCYMAFADYCLFAMASAHLQSPGVTVGFACEFLDAAREGELIECDGEVTRAGGSLIFLRGTLRSERAKTVHLLRHHQAGEVEEAAGGRRKSYVAMQPASLCRLRG
jgi:acyl-coenzyme A thioesterase PaaI-like protein